MSREPDYTAGFVGLVIIILLVSLILSLIAYLVIWTVALLPIVLVGGWLLGRGWQMRSKLFSILMIASCFLVPTVIQWIVAILKTDVDGLLFQGFSRFLSWYYPLGGIVLTVTLVIWIRNALTGK